jgi:biopolymer transport protein ExbB
MWESIAQLSGYFASGGYVMPPLIVATVILWWALGYRMRTLQRGSVRSTRVMLFRYLKGKKPSHQGVLSRVLRKGMALYQQDLPDLRKHLDDAFSEDVKDIKKYRVIITTIVLTAPLLGLLGTVSGMIETFDSLGDMSLFTQTGGIAGGISQALITTQMGLAVAIPGLIVNGILNKKQNRLEIEIAQIKDYLCSPLMNEVERHEIS